MIRLYIADIAAAFSAGLSLALDTAQSRYLTSVMRLGVDDQVLVFNGRNGEWRTRLVEAGKKAVRLELMEQTRVQTPANGPTLLIALVKRGPLETIVEKATELGVARIHLLTTRRSNASHTNVERLRLIARESAEQTERLDVPDVLQSVKLETILHDNNFDAIIFGDEESTHETGDKPTKPMLEALKNVPAGAKTAILIGPEGGFDDAERAALRDLRNVIPVNLGPRILRADTAAIAALALYQAVAGDWI